MKKLFSIVLIALMSIVTLNAETTRIYCKMAQDWWKVDGAAVGCYAWGTSGPNADWPGVRMTPVEGEADMWYIDLDTTEVKNVIFTRFNPTDNGNLNWGAKTGDLVIPTNGDNLFTITKSSECWADNDCTCDGEWSKYVHHVITYKDTAYYVAGNFTNWAAEMKALPAEVELPADSTIEFRQVMTRTVMSDGDSIKKDTTWYGQVGEGNKMSRESNAWLLDGKNNVLLTTDQEGKYVFDMNEKGEFVVTFPAIDSTIYLIAKSANWEKQAMSPVNDTLFSLKVNYEAAVVDPFLLLQHTTWWKIADDAIDMSRESCTNWGLVCVAPEGKGLKDVTVRIDKAGEYEFIWDNKNHLISIVYPAAEVKRDTTMYVAGNFTNWAEEMQALPYTIALPADSALEFKQVRIIITTMDGEVADRDTTWFGQAGEGNKMTRESSAWLLDGENNVLLTTDAEGEYTFALNENGEFVVTWPYKCEGEFGILVNDQYLPAEINPEHDGGIEYMLIDVELAENDSVQLFDHCSSAGWAEGVQYMENSYQFFVENGKFVVKEAGLYDFYFQLGQPDLLYVKLHSDPQAVENIEAMSAPIKFIENGQLYIIRGEHTFDAQGKMIR